MLVTVVRACRTERGPRRSEHPLYACNLYKYLCMQWEQGLSPVHGLGWQWDTEMEKAGVPCSPLWGVMVRSKVASPQHDLGHHNHNTHIHTPAWS